MRRDFWTPRAGAYVCLLGSFLAWSIWSAVAPGRPYSLALAPPLFYAICRSYRMYVRRCEEGRLNRDEIETLHSGTIEALSLALHAKDPETRGHLGRVRVYAVELAREMGVRGRELECLQAAALLHDIGKLALPERIASKPGKLTPDEFEKVKAHPLVGAEILERAGFDPMVPAIVRAHHERWDGSGSLWARGSFRRWTRSTRSRATAGIEKLCLSRKRCARSPSGRAPVSTPTWWTCWRGGMRSWNAKLPGKPRPAPASRWMFAWTSRRSLPPASKQRHRGRHKAARTRMNRKREYRRHGNLHHTLWHATWD